MEDPIADPNESRYTPARCYECKELFASYPGCAAHARQTGHKPDPAYFCMRPDCSGTFMDIRTRRQHLKRWRHGDDAQEEWAPEERAGAPALVPAVSEGGAGAAGQPARGVAPPPPREQVAVSPSARGIVLPARGAAPPVLVRAPVQTPVPTRTPIAEGQEIVGKGSTRGGAQGAVLPQRNVARAGVVGTGGTAEARAEAGPARSAGGAAAGNGAPPSNPGPPAECTKCKAQFPSGELLQKHFDDSDLHPNCGCGMGFMNLGAWAEHKKRCPPPRTGLAATNRVNGVPPAVSSAPRAAPKVPGTSSLEVELKKYGAPAPPPIAPEKPAEVIQPAVSVNGQSKTAPTTVLAPPPSLGPRPPSPHSDWSGLGKPLSDTESVPGSPDRVMSPAASKVLTEQTPHVVQALEDRTVKSLAEYSAPTKSRPSAVAPPQLNGTAEHALDHADPLAASRRRATSILSTASTRDRQYYTDTPPIGTPMDSPPETPPLVTPPMFLPPQKLRPSAAVEALHAAAVASAPPELSFHCRACLQNPCRDPVTTICGHLFCAECLFKALHSTGACPACKSVFFVKMHVDV